MTTSTAPAALAGDLIFCGTCPADPFGPPEQVTVDQLAEGDFVVSFAAQNGIRALRVNSGIATIAAPAAGRWKSGAYRQRKQPILSRAITFKSADAPRINVPLTHEVTVRRPAR